MSDRFNAFQEFVGAYFHPDWRLDDPDAMSVVSDFVLTSHATQREAVTADIDALLSLRLDETELHDRVLGEYDLNYDPHSDGITMRDWLMRVREVITRADGETAAES